MQNNFIKVKYDFFYFYDNIYHACKEVPIFYQKDHPAYNTPETRKIKFPGQRSLLFNEINPLFHVSLISEASKVFNVDPNNFSEVESSLHLRLDSDDEEDFIHQDTAHTLLIYLSPTNLNSGTTFYDHEDREIARVSFVQNTAVFFDGSIRHKSLRNFGDNIDNGRLTINIFFKH